MEVMLPEYTIAAGSTRVRRVCWRSLVAYYFQRLGDE
jgi:hypothetical protein